MTMAMQPTIPEPAAKHDRSPLGVVWVTPPYSVVAAGLEKMLEAKAHVHWGLRPPEEPPSLVVLYTNGEDLTPDVRKLQAQAPDSPVLVLGPRAELALARAALQAGAKGFIHAQMPPQQIVRALEVVTRKGEHVVPRELLKALVEEGEPQAELAKLTPQKREILRWAAEGLSNAQIARRFFLSESTIKQHLRAAYKVLGVRNRIQAATVFRRSEQLGGGGATDAPPSERRRTVAGVPSSRGGA
jgi:DNA-binding NarL/FixJ family response regulator